MILCACEEVSNQDVDAAIRLGARTVDDVKRLTRCGMGFCQGLYCREAVIQMLGTRSWPRFRVPVRPIAMAALTRTTRDDDTGETS